MPPDIDLWFGAEVDVDEDGCLGLKSVSMKPLDADWAERCDEEQIPPGGLA